MAVDLHVHSTVSDGSYTPAELVQIAVERGLTALAIADHDTVDGVAAGQQAAAGRLTFLPAVEISTHHGHHELHILGYMLDLDHEPLLAELDRIQEERIKRARRTVEVLQGLGVALGYDQVEAVAAGGSIGRPHIATALVAAGAVATPSAAFDRYLKRGRPAYVDRYRLSPARAIELIRGAGGLPVLAHPKLVRRDALIPELVASGLGGLELYHIQHTPYDVERYTRLAERWRLVQTGGSDSHGPRGTYPVEVGQVNVPDACAEAVLAWKAGQLQEHG
jgi:predicted metal-dependent phosphoesterase TrpH